jgi:hypothetical protein
MLILFLIVSRRNPVHQLSPGLLGKRGVTLYFGLLPFRRGASLIEYYKLLRRNILRVDEHREDVHSLRFLFIASQWN